MQINTIILLLDSNRIIRNLIKHSSKSLKPQNHISRQNENLSKVHGKSLGGSLHNKLKVRNHGGENILSPGQVRHLGDNEKVQLVCPPFLLLGYIQVEAGNQVVIHELEAGSRVAATRWEQQAGIQREVK